MENTKRTLTITTQMLLITMLVMPPLLPPTTFCMLLKLSDFVHSIDNMCPHFLFTTAIDFIRLARFITLFMTQLFYIKRDEMLKG